jgi:serine/threonine-protein kinase
MATVHYGRMTGPAGFSRTVAIKRLHPQFAKAPEFVAMLIDEARLAARIRHPNVVSILDIVTAGDEMLLVLEYVQGVTLSHVMRQASARPVPLPIAIAIASGVLDGLHAAHEARAEDGAPLAIVHRDVSPQNILLGADGVARVADFGIAKAAGRLQTTRDGQIKGKTAYMAPEQIRAHAVDRRTDVYAASVVLWEVLAGRRLFRADSPAGVMNAILESDIPPISTVRPEVTPELAAVVHKGLSRDPADRFGTAREMAVALDRAVAPASAREIGDWVGATATQILEERARHVADMEASSSEASKIVGGVVADVPEKKAADGETQTTDASLVSDSVSARRRRPAAWVVIALAALGIGGAALVFSGVHRAEPGAAPAPSSPTLADSALPPAIPLPSSSPASSAPEPAASGSASATVAPSSEAGGAPRRPAHPPAASPVHRRIDCDTPYEIDASGKRHWKKGC